MNERIEKIIKATEGTHKTILTDLLSAAVLVLDNDEAFNSAIATDAERKTEFLRFVGDVYDVVRS